MTAPAERLERARAAHRGRDWPAAYDLLSELRRSHRLDPDDLSALGDAAWWLGLIRETLEVCEECHQRYLQEGRLDRAAMIAIETGFNWYLRGEPDIGSGWISRARRLLADQPEGVGHGYLTWLEAAELAEAGDVDGALPLARRLQEMATELGEPALGCFGLALEGTLRIRQGGVERGLGLLDEAMLPVLAGKVAPEVAGNLYCQMMVVCHDLADPGRARRWTEATRKWCDTFASAVMFVGICRVHRTQLLRLEGDWDAALREATAASVELAELNAEAVAEAHYEIGETHRLRGELPAARASYDAAAALGRVPEPGASLLLLAEGRSDDAASSIWRALTETEDPFRRARLLAAQVEIACARADTATAEAATSALTTIAETYRSPGFRAWAALARGAVLLGRGTPGEALAPLREALASYEAMRATYDAATARALLGRALEADGDRVAAEPELDAALAAFRALGAAPRPPGAAGAVTTGETRPGGLTDREAQVLRLIAQGLSTREVAGRLVISEKTVARHLANVFAKIDVSSRTAASAWAHRNGLVDARPAGPS